VKPSCGKAQVLVGEGECDVWRQSSEETVTAKKSGKARTAGIALSEHAERTHPIMSCCHCGWMLNAVNTTAAIGIQK